MTKIKMDLKMVSQTEKWHKTLFGEIENNKISYFDDGFDITITWSPEKLLLVKKNNKYKISLNLENNKSSCLYQDYETNFELKLKIMDEMFTYGDNYVNMRYVVEETNKVSYELFFEVIE